MRVTFVAVLALATATAGGDVLPWIEDYSKAVEQARARDVPIFVEAWAPW